MRCSGCGRLQTSYDLDIGWCVCGAINTPCKDQFCETPSSSDKDKLNMAENFLVKLQRECTCDITCRKCHEINEILRKLF